MGRHEFSCPKDCPNLNEDVCIKYNNIILEQKGWLKEYIKCFSCRNQTNTGDNK